MNSLQRSERVFDSLTQTPTVPKQKIKIEFLSPKPLEEIQLANVASAEETACQSLKEAEYGIGDEELTRKLDKETGYGFWDKIIEDLRMVCYGGGEYVQPHYHDIDEVFTIKKGGCHVWTSEDLGKTWQYQYCGKGELRIPGGSIHCLVADNKEGLCMDVFKDSKRTINWFDKHDSAAWSRSLEYKVTIQELIAATQGNA